MSINYSFVCTHVHICILYKNIHVLCKMYVRTYVSVYCSCQYNCTCIDMYIHTLGWVGSLLNFHTTCLYIMFCVLCVES